MKSVNQIINTPKMKLLREDTCSKCGYDTKIYEMRVIGGPDAGKRIEVPYGCRCRDIEIAKSAIESRKQMRKRKLQKMFDRFSLINRDLVNKTIQDYIPHNKDQEKAKQTVIQYIDDFNIDDPQNLTIHGSIGVGKSHLAKTISDAVMGKNYTSIFISVPKLLRKIRSTYQNDSKTSEDELFKALEETDVLILDDIGAEKESEWSNDRLFDLIDTRQGKHTIFTTNYKPSSLETIFGERLYSRIIYNVYDQIEIVGDNYRKTK